MSDKPSLPPPPLSLQALGEVRSVEDTIQEALQDCGDNLERVRQVLHTGVAEKLNVEMDYYFSLPNHQTAWFAQLIPRTIGSIIGLCTPFAPGEQFFGELLLTAAHHVEQRLEAEAIKIKLRHLSAVLHGRAQAWREFPSIAGR